MMALMTIEPEASDGDLARCAASGDRDAFSALVGRHYDFVFRLAWRLTGNRMDAEDIAQDVCARLGKAIRSYRGGSAFTTWLYAIVVNAVRDAGRRSARDNAKTQAWAAYAATTGEAEPERPDPADALWAAVRMLSPKQCEAVTLVYGEDLGHAQAADLMGCTEATVSWHIHEAKKRLKTIMSAGEV